MDYRMCLELSLGWKLLNTHVTPVLSSCCCILYPALPVSMLDSVMIEQFLFCHKAHATCVTEETWFTGPVKSSYMFPKCVFCSQLFTAEVTCE